jgi:predicted transcriptional regulator
LEFISAFDNKEAGRKRLSKVVESKTVNSRHYKGFNFFDKNDTLLLLTIVRGEFNINGLRNKHLQKLLNLSASKISRIIKRLLVHGLIKKVKNSYKYYVSKLGKKSYCYGSKNQRNIDHSGAFVLKFLAKITPA